MALDYSLDDEVWLEPTVGHTPGHVAIQLAGSSGRALMCGDVMHGPVQCEHPESISSSEEDPGLGCRVRRAFLERNCETDQLVLTAHFPVPSAGHIVRVEKGISI